MVHRTQFKVRFYELDPYDHVNHTAYFGYFETARVEALESTGWGLHRLKEMGVQIVVVEMNARFEIPAVAGDTVAVQSEMLEVKRASSAGDRRCYGTVRRSQRSTLKQLPST